VGTYAAIGITSGGVVHVLFRDATVTNLVHRSRSSGSWSSATVIDTTADTGQYVSLAIDSKDFVHASYYDVTSTGLKYITNLTGSWAIDVIEAGGQQGAPSAIAIDAGDAPHILYRDAVNYDIKHAWRESSGWKKSIAQDMNSNFFPYGARWGLVVQPDGAINACVVVATAPNNVLVRRLTYAGKPYGVTSAWDVVNLEWMGATTWCSSAKPASGTVHHFWGNRSGNDARSVNNATAQPGSELVDATGDRGQWTGLVRDSSGTLHVSYRDNTNGKLRYARKLKGGLWESANVDTTTNNVGNYTSIAVDGSGAVHIAYYDGSAGDLRYVKGTLGAWGTPQIVDASGTTGLYTSITVDSAGTPAIAYYDASNQDLKFAFKFGNSWLNQAVDSQGNVGTYATSVVDGSDTYHIAYRAGSQLKYVRGKPGAWETPFNIDTSGQNGEWNDIALDSGGNPHVSHYSASSTEIRHTWSTKKGDAGSWTTEVVRTNGATGQPGLWTSIAIDANDNIYTSFYDNTPTIAVKSGGAWTFVVPDNVTAYYTSIVVTSDGEWHSVYYNANAGDLRHATNALSAYTNPYVVAYSGSVGWYTSLALGAKDQVWIAYQDISNTSLKLAWSEQGVYFSTQLEMPNNVGSWASIALGSDGTVHIAYRDESNFALRYGVYSNGTWKSEQVDVANNPGVGTYTSIAVDADGKVTISYYAASNGDLKVAQGKAGSWAIAAIDQANTTGQMTSCALDGKGAAHVAYYYATGADLRYLTNKTGSFGSPEIVDTTGTMGQWPSITVDEAQAAHIAYKDASALDLKYATNKGGVWGFSIIDTAGNVGDYTSIALNAVGSAYIGYQDGTNLNTKIATNVSGSWQSFTVDAPGNVGYYLHAALGADKKVRMSYLNWSNNALRVAVVGIDNSVDQNCDGY